MAAATATDTTMATATDDNLDPDMDLDDTVEKEDLCLDNGNDGLTCGFIMEDGIRKSSRVAAIVQQQEQIAEEKKQIVEAEQAAAELKQQQVESKRIINGQQSMRLFVKKLTAEDAALAREKFKQENCDKFNKLTQKMKDTGHPYTATYLDEDTKELQSDLGVLAAERPGDPPVLFCEQPRTYRPPGSEWAQLNIQTIYIMEMVLLFLAAAGIRAPRIDWVMPRSWPLLDWIPVYQL